ncbi:acyl-CoA thioesterase [Deinococcus sp. KNUC1210]|uniref:acyl-CoA thioesterase n=1 Tax=Deinococcus sp. KNUC1210 TaxID=2917691 RepID=UPI001EF06468|nr:thioesterase family protein [Deinococcus sp. KNUC1210]ULH16643.1 acyl-CoA thioesterase [Deinococcus sp. KNUC1210]
MTDSSEVVGFPVSQPLRVRWAEVDAQQVVFNGHYLMYADVCCTEYFRMAGVDLWTPAAALSAAPHPDALDAYVVRATLDYRAPARFDDLLLLRGRIARLGTSSFTFECRIERGPTLLCRVELIYVNAHEGASVPLPGSFRAAVRAFQGELESNPSET